MHGAHHAGHGGHCCVSCEAFTVCTGSMLCLMMHMHCVQLSMCRRRFERLKLVSLFLSAVTRRVCFVVKRVCVCVQLYDYHLV